VKYQNYVKLFILRSGDRWSLSNNFKMTYPRWYKNRDICIKYFTNITSIVNLSTAVNKLILTYLLHGAESFLRN